MIEKEYIIVGYLIRDGRLKKGLSVSDLANKMGMPRSTLSSIESGKSRSSFHVIIKLCRYLQINLQSLI